MGRQYLRATSNVQGKEKRGGKYFKKKNPPKKTEPVQKIMNYYYIKTRTKDRKINSAKGEKRHIVYL